MKAVNYSEFRQHLKAHLDNVTDNHNTLIVPGNGDNSVVIISLKEYNSIQETLHLMKSDNSISRLIEALERANNGDTEQHDLIDD